MKKSTTIITFLVGLIVIFIITCIVLFAGKSQVAIGPTVDQPATALGDVVRFTTAPTQTSVVCGITSTLAVASSSERIYLAAINDATSTIYLSLGQQAVGSKGIRLNAAGGSFEINQDNLFTGQIFCIASTTAVLTITQK